MKKMLRKLFLFLFLSVGLSFSIADGSSYTDEAYIQERVEQIEYNKLILSLVAADLEGEIADLAYQSVDSIPIKSPISLVELKRISSDYGYRVHPILKKWMFHRGLDMVAPKGTEICATADGTIVTIEKSDHGYGNQVVIKHGYGYKTRYAHLSNIRVNIGQAVKSGDVIGTLGSSGLTTGPHLHYEIISNNKPVDPMFFSYADVSERSRSGYLKTLMKLEAT